MQRDLYHGLRGLDGRVGRVQTQPSAACLILAELKDVVSELVELLFNGLDARQDSLDRRVHPGFSPESVAAFTHDPQVELSILLADSGAPFVASVEAGGLLPVGEALEQDYAHASVFEGRKGFSQSGTMASIDDASAIRRVDESWYGNAERLRIPPPHGEGAGRVEPVVQTFRM